MGAGAGQQAAARNTTGPQGTRACASSLPAIGSLWHKPGPGDADETPERGEDDDREGKGVSGHGSALDAQAG